MYQMDTLVVYGNSGVCRVMSVGSPDFSGEGDKLYYTLAPVYGTETIYAPVEGKIPMRPVLSKSEAEGLIAEMPEIPPEQFEGGNLQYLSHYYQTAFEASDCHDLVRLLKTIYAKDSQTIKLGKRPGKIEERYRKRAEELLHGELAVALGIPCESVPDYIENSRALA